MFREILVAQGNSLTLDLPNELVGKQIEVLAFELKEPVKPEVKKALSEEEIARRMTEIRAIVAPHRIDLSNFKFDRDEANNYDE